MVRKIGGKRKNHRHIDYHMLIQGKVLCLLRILQGMMMRSYGIAGIFPWISKNFLGNLNTQDKPSMITPNIMIQTKFQLVSQKVKPTLIHFKEFPRPPRI